MPTLPLPSPRARERGARCLCRDSVNHRRAAAVAPRFRHDPPFRTSPKDRVCRAGLASSSASRARAGQLFSDRADITILRFALAVIRPVPSREPLGLGASSSSAAASSRPRRSLRLDTLLTTVNRPCEYSTTRPPWPHPWPRALPARPARRRARYTSAGFQGSPQWGARSVRPTARALRPKNPRS